jgi:2-polyprenyl-6-hydroxyphenyl methylase/3-demethylubiquinone-9 3-methyltransferase
MPNMTDNQITSNVDPSEIEKFSQLAHRWWDKESEFKPLHAINPLRLDWIKSHTSIEGRLIVDIGCGGGILSESLAHNGAQVTGIDLAQKSLKVAKLHALEGAVKGLEYLEVSAESLAQERPGFYDVVTCMEMLEHVPDPSSVVCACAELVKPGGWVFCSTINRNLQCFLMAIVGAEYLLNLLPRGTHEYAKFIRPSELIAFAEVAGLNVVGMTGMHHNPLTQRYWLGEGTNVNYFLALQRPAD